MGFKLGDACEVAGSAAEGFAQCWFQGRIEAVTRPSSRAHVSDDLEVGAAQPPRMLAPRLPAPAQADPHAACRACWHWRSARAQGARPSPPQPAAVLAAGASCISMTQPPRSCTAAGLPLLSSSPRALQKPASLPLPPDLLPRFRAPRRPGRGGGAPRALAARAPRAARRRGPAHPHGVPGGCCAERGLQRSWVLRRGRDASRQQADRVCCHGGSPLLLRLHLGTLRFVAWHARPAAAQHPSPACRPCMTAAGGGHRCVRGCGVVARRQGGLAKHACCTTAQLHANGCVHVAPCIPALLSRADRVPPCALLKTPLQWCATASAPAACPSTS